MAKGVHPGMIGSTVGHSKYELDTPALLVDLGRMERNIGRMTDVFRSAGINWRPHTKGQKIPAIAHMEIAAGAIGITCAKLGEAEVMADAGIKDILIANQIVGSTKVARYMNLCARADVIVAVDNMQNVRELEVAAREKAVNPRVMVEVNLGMDRCGVMPGEPAVSLSREVAQSESLRYAGLMGWEGHTMVMPETPEKRHAVEKAVGLLTMSAQMCQEGRPHGRDRELRRKRYVHDISLATGDHRDSGRRRHLPRHGVRGCRFGARVRSYGACDRNQPSGVRPNRRGRWIEGHVGGPCCASSHRSSRGGVAPSPRRARCDDPQRARREPTPR